MLCDRCHAREATVHYTEIVNGRKKEEHLCRECAAKEDLFQNGFSSWDPWNGGFWKDHFFGSLLGEENRETEKPMSCTKCGETYEDFQKKGLLSCPECYNAFRDRLKNVLDKVHGHHVHTGKQPQPKGEAAKMDPALLKLKEALKTSIAEENYEEAAKIRDEIAHFGEKGGSAK